jgi:hypothetical protein
MSVRKSDLFIAEMGTAQSGDHERQTSNYHDGCTFGLSFPG